MVYSSASDSIPVNHSSDQARLCAVRLLVGLSMKDMDNFVFELAKDMLHLAQRQLRRPHYMRAPIQERYSDIAMEGLPAIAAPTPHCSPRVRLGDLTSLQSRRPSGNCIQIWAPGATIDQVPILGPLATLRSTQHITNSTVAIMQRAPPYPPVIAVSGFGWERRTLLGSGYLIDRLDWTCEVRRLCNYLAHTLKSHNWDKDFGDGLYHACHAEKQVATYFARAHGLFPDEDDKDPKIKLLETLQPSERLREAWIAVDHQPCDDCSRFIKVLESLLKVKFHMVLMDEDFRGPKTPTRPSLAGPVTPPSSRRRRSHGRASSFIVSDDEESYGDMNDMDDMNKLGDQVSPHFNNTLRPRVRKNPSRYSEDLTISPSPSVTSSPSISLPSQPATPQPAIPVPKLPTTNKHPNSRPGRTAVSNPSLSRKELNLYFGFGYPLQHESPVRKRERNCGEYCGAAVDARNPGLRDCKRAKVSHATAASQPYDMVYISSDDDDDVESPTARHEHEHGARAAHDLGGVVGALVDTIADVTDVLGEDGLRVHDSHDGNYGHGAPQVQELQNLAKGNESLPADGRVTIDLTDINSEDGVDEYVPSDYGSDS
jgi:hypothetical protein